MNDYRLIQPDCFAFRNGKHHPECNALSEMMCKYMLCPFYKSMWKYSKELKKYPVTYKNPNVK